MTAGEAIRFLEHEARRCRSRHQFEALCLLLPSLMRCLELEAMDDWQAESFRAEFKRALEARPALTRRAA